MPHPLEACYLKLKRADRHLRELRDAIDEFLESSPYTISFDADPETMELTLWAAVQARPNTVEWGTMIGDVVHNLRSALDQLLWQDDSQRENSSAGTNEEEQSVERHRFPYPVEAEAPRKVSSVRSVD